MSVTNGGRLGPEIVGPVYFDTSAWAKLFLAEAESGMVNRDFAGRSDLLASELGVTELVSAAARAIRSSRAGVTATAVQRAALGQVRAGVFALVGLTPVVHCEAERLLALSGGPPLSAADALHLALALAGQAATMASYDQRLRAAAAAQGLALYPPA